MAEIKVKTATKQYFAIFAAGFCVYFLSTGSGPLFQDSGMYQYRIYNNDIVGNLGLALSHSLYHVIGIAVKNIPFGDFGLKTNMISVVCGALTVANIFLLLRLMTGKAFPALIGAMSLLFSWTFWQHSTIAEDYSMYTAFLSAELLLLYAYFKTDKQLYLYWVAFCNGLALSVHMLAVIPLACYFVIIIYLFFSKQLHFKTVLAMLFAWIIGAGLYEFLVIREMIASGDITGTIKSALFGNKWADDVLNTSMSWRLIKENFLFIAYNFPTPNFLLFFAGLLGLYKAVDDKRMANCLMALLVLFFLFAFRYTVPDRYAFFISFYCIFAIILGLGTNLFLSKLRYHAIKLLVLFFATIPVAIYAATPILADKYNVDLGIKRRIPYRNEYKHFLSPWGHTDGSAERFAIETLTSLSDKAIILADGTTVYPLWYVQTIDGIRPDIDIVSRHGSYKSDISYPSKANIVDLLKEVDIYVVSPVKGYCPSFLLEEYKFKRSGPVFKVVSKS